ncbi:hypothetical protein M5K25_008149 [Dendrobium thyrsiflorum]|uniref:Uncharacterized protein n=1 Tax=Dendrobium thyrsiflorum TaxID=117978 RepID=A0ABD0VF14_DENTH
MVELEREKILGGGVWRGFHTVAPASSHRSTSKSRFVLREVLKKKTALVSKDQRLSSEYVNKVSGSLPSPGSGEKGHRFSAFAERLEKERFSAFAERLEGKAVLYGRKKIRCLCRKVGRKSGSLPEEEGSLPSPRSGEKDIGSLPALGKV